MAKHGRLVNIPRWWVAIVGHHVNLQCVGESGGSVIVLFAAVWLFFRLAS